MVCVCVCACVCVCMCKCVMVCVRVVPHHSRLPTNAAAISHSNCSCPANVPIYQPLLCSAGALRPAFRTTTKVFATAMFSGTTQLHRTPDPRRQAHATPLLQPASNIDSACPTQCYMMHLFARSTTVAAAVLCFFLATTPQRFPCWPKLQPGSATHDGRLTWAVNRCTAAWRGADGHHWTGCPSLS